MSVVAQMIGSLIAVVVLILGCAWLAKRMPLAGAGRSDMLEIKASLSVGTRERVVLVRAGDRTLVLGVAPGRVNTLHVLGDEPHSGAEFSNLLQQEDSA